MYNKKLLNDAGITAAPKTWDELKAAAATIEEKTGKSGVYLNPQGYFMLPFIYGEGGDLIDPEAKKITVNAPEAVAGVEKEPELPQVPRLRQAAGHGRLHSHDERVQGRQRRDDHQRSVGAQQHQGRHDLRRPREPRHRAGPNSPRPEPPSAVSDWSFWSGMPQEKAAGAIAFIKFMASAESQAKLADKLGLLPTRTSAYDKVTNSIISEFKPVMEVAVERAWIPEGGKLFGPLDEAATKILVQGADAQTALDEVARKYKTEVVKDYSTQ